MKSSKSNHGTMFPSNKALAGEDGRLDVTIQRKKVAYKA